MIMQDDMGLNDDNATDKVSAPEEGAVEPGAEIGVEEPGLDADEDDDKDEEVI